MANLIALRSMLIFQEQTEPSGSKVRRTLRDPGGVNLWVCEVGQSFAVGCHPSCGKING